MASLSLVGRLTMAFKIDRAKCVGCGACAYICLFGAVTPAKIDCSCYKIDETKCVECSQCTHICPNDAIISPEGYKKIKSVTVNADACKGCSLCSRNCKAGAITGKVKEPFVINQEKCFKCGVCATKCRFDAISVEYF